MFKVLKAAPAFCSTARYFDQISKGTEKVCFGIKDTLRALEMGAVETLIVYENLEHPRYVPARGGYAKTRTSPDRELTFQRPAAQPGWFSSTIRQARRW